VGGVLMIFSDIRVKDINGVLHYTPQVMKFTTKNRHDHIIGIQLSGNAEHFFADHRFTLDENCIYFFNQKEDYKVEVAEKSLCFSVHFTTYVPIKVKSFCIKIKDNSAIVRILNSIEHQFRSAGGCTAKCLSELYKLFGSFEDIYSKKYLPKDTKLSRAKEYMNLHFKEDDCIIKAAEKYGVTKRRFNDIFKQNFHTTPNQYIIDYKIGLAKKLLCSKELSIGDISNLCGFEDIYYFSKTFKKVTGQTASNFRKQI
jgi:AraC-like DNA-binding protein